MTQGRTRYEHFELQDILWLLETAALCPPGTLGPFLKHEGVSEPLLHKWRAKYGSSGQKLREELEAKAGKISVKKAEPVVTKLEEPKVA